MGDEGEDPILLKGAKADQEIQETTTTEIIRTSILDEGGPSEGGNNVNTAMIKETVLVFSLLNATYEFAGGLIRSVNTIYLVDNGLTIAQAFVVNASYSFGTLLFEVPTGVTADLRGRRFSYILSSVIQMIGTLMFLGPLVFDDTNTLYAIFIIATVVMGLGYTFATGALEAWFVDELKFYGHDEEKLDVTLASAQAVAFFAMLSGIGTGAILAAFINIEVTYMGRAAFLLINLAIAVMRMKEFSFTPDPNHQSMGAQMKSIAKASIKYGFVHKESRLLIANEAFSSGVMFWAFYVWQIYILDLAGTDNAGYSGLYMILNMFGIVVATATEGSLMKCFSLRSSFLSAFQGMSVVCMFLMGIYPEFISGIGSKAENAAVYIVGFLGVLAAFAFGAKKPVRQAYLHRIIPSDQRATLISVDSLFTNILATIAQIGLGYASELLDPDDSIKSIGRAHMIGAAIQAIGILCSVALQFVGSDVNRIVHETSEEATENGKEPSNATANQDDKAKQDPVDEELYDE